MRKFFLILSVCIASFPSVIIFIFALLHGGIGFDQETMYLIPILLILAGLNGLSYIALLGIWGSSLDKDTREKGIFEKKAGFLTAWVISTILISITYSFIFVSLYLTISRPIYDGQRGLGEVLLLITFLIINLPVALMSFFIGYFLSKSFKRLFVKNPAQ